jgi:hypothetical protein
MPSLKCQSICDDKMELHTLLCDPHLRDTALVVYLNWKADEMGRLAPADLRAQVKATIPDDLEFHTAAFIDRQIIVVDEMEGLQPYLLDLKHRLAPDGPAGGMSAAERKKKDKK